MPIRAELKLGEARLAFGVGDATSADAAWLDSYRATHDGHIPVDGGGGPPSMWNHQGNQADTDWLEAYRAAHDGHIPVDQGGGPPSLWDHHGGVGAPADGGQDSLAPSGAPEGPLLIGAHPWSPDGWLL